VPREVEVMPFLACLGLSITARCPVACSHCIIEASPKRKEEMSAADAERWLRLAASYGNGRIQSVVVTGGEPFYNLSLLQEVLGSAQRNGLVPAVVTNAFWARDATEAVAVLEGLPQIRMLSISADAYHRRRSHFRTS